MKIDVIISADDIKEEKLKGKAVVIIDVLRATSVMVTALSRGCKRIVPVREVEEAIILARRDREGTLLGGERDGIKLEGFHFSNSPLDYTKEAVEEKTLVMTTTNGTRAIKNSENADEILIGAMINGRAVAEKLVELNKDIVIVNAGTYGQFSMDDFITSGYIIRCIKNILEEEMKQEPVLSDIAVTAEYIYNTNPDIFTFVEKAAHYKRLEYLGYSEDLKYCFHKDKVDIVPIYKDGEIVILN